MLITVESVHKSVIYCMCVCMHVFVLQISGSVRQFIHRSFDLVLVADLNTEFLIERAVKTRVCSILTFVTEDA